MKSKSGKDHRRDKAMMEQVKANFEADRNTRFYDVEFEGAKKANMTEKECERKLLDMMDAAWRLFKDLYPEADGLSMFGNTFGNCAMGYKRDAAGNVVYIVDGYLSPSGERRFSR